MFGLLNVHKPPGITSRDAVNRVQRLVRPIKVGHAGTLDPLASGVLILCLGPATRLIEYVQRMQKTYRGTFLLGRESTTEDVEGEITQLESVPQPTASDVESTLPQFIGTIQQIPPAYSALKVGGRRAYELAREGHDVQLAPRPIEVFSLRLAEFDYPEMVLDIECGSGTYVRSLGRDIARRLETAAIMSALERTAIGCFEMATAMRIDNLTIDQIERHLIPPIRALDALQRVRLDNEEIDAIRFGQKLKDRFGLSEATEAAAVDSEGRLLAILQKGEDCQLRPKRNFAVNEQSTRTRR